jgi:hypothetical protein
LGARLRTAGREDQSEGVPGGARRRRRGTEGVSDGRPSREGGGFRAGWWRWNGRTKGRVGLGAWGVGRLSLKQNPTVFFFFGSDGYVSLEGFVWEKSARGD